VRVERQAGQRLQRLRRGRTLERDQAGARRRVVDDAGGASMFLEPVDVLVDVRRVDDGDVVVGLQAVDDQIVDDATRRQAGDGVERAAVFQAPDIIGDQSLDRGGGAGAREVHLAHVADVEHAHRGPGGAVLVQDSGRVRHGHRPAAEVHHLGSQPHMGVVERGASHPGAHPERNARRIQAAPAVEVTDKGPPGNTPQTVGGA
jgi:hypothetical protein